MNNQRSFSRCLILAAAMASVPAWADSNPGIQLGEPAYGGNGCPAGTASATLSPDGTALSILFDQYSAEAGGATGKRVDRKSCNVAIPVHVPQGYSVSVMQVDYRGFNALPQGAQSQFNVEYFFAGARGPQFQRPFYGPVSEDFTVNNQLVAESLVWSACGADVNLRTNSSMTVQTNYRGEQALATVDSADIQASIIYHLQWKRCGSDSPSPIPYPEPLPQPQPDPRPRPEPATQVGNCSVESNVDYYGNLEYVVRDINGNVVDRARDFQTAVNLARIDDRNGRCGRRYDPYPQPDPYPRPNACRIVSGRNGRGELIYRVEHQTGAVLAVVYSYGEAVRAMNSHPRCR